MSRLDMYIIDTEKSISDVPFFVPGYTGIDAEEEYQRLRRLNEITSKERIYAIAGRYCGQYYKEVVGEKSSENGEIVLAIFLSSGNHYETVTESRGTRNGGPVAMSISADRVILFNDNVSEM